MRLRKKMYPPMKTINIYIIFYTDEHLKWNNPPEEDCLLTDLSVTVAFHILWDAFKRPIINVQGCKYKYIKYYI